MTSLIMLEREIRDEARLLVKLDTACKQAMFDGNAQEVAEIWQKREVVRIRRSYLMRMLWTAQGVPE